MKITKPNKNMKISIIILTICILFIHPAQNLGLSCEDGQSCVRYDKCPHTVKIAIEILATDDATKKQKLVEKFKELHCGNYSVEKTVCCDTVNDHGKPKILWYTRTVNSLNALENLYQLVLVFSRSRNFYTSFK